MNYKGVVIEESLKDNNVLQKVSILKTRVEKVTPKHQTPWLNQWTLHTVRISEKQSVKIMQEISETILSKPGTWYADFKNDKFHYIVFPKKVFRVDFKKPKPYNEIRKYGLSLGIPDYQMQFERLKR